MNWIGFTRATVLIGLLSVAICTRSIGRAAGQPATDEWSFAVGDWYKISVERAKAKADWQYVSFGQDNAKADIEGHLLIPA